MLELPSIPRRMKPHWSRLHTLHQLRYHPVCMREIAHFSEPAKADFASFLAAIDGQDRFSMLLDLNETLRLALPPPVEEMNGREYHVST
jgi:hypothetical protein